jgi:hypothetical protein
VLGVDHDRHVAEQAVGPELADQGQPAVARQAELGEDEVDPDVAADQGHGGRGGVDGGEPMPAAGENALHGFSRHLVAVDQEYLRHWVREGDNAAPPEWHRAVPVAPHRHRTGRG